MCMTILNPPQLGLEFVSATFQKQVPPNSHELQGILSEADLLNHPSVEAEKVINGFSVYLGNKKAVQDSFIPVGENVVDLTLREVQKNFNSDLETPTKPSWFSNLFGKNNNMPQESRIKGTHEYFLNWNPMDMALVQPNSEGRFPWKVHPLLATLARLVNPNYGAAEIAELEIPKPLQEYYPSSAKLLEIAQTTAHGFQAQRVITLEEFAERGNVKEIIAPALEFSQKLKPDFSDSLMFPVIKAIQKNL